MPLQAFTHWQFADRFGWPPDVVDRQSAAALDGLLAVDDIVRQIRAGANTPDLPGRT